MAYGGRISINDLAKKIIAILGSKSEIIYKPERPGDVKHSTAAIDKLKKAGFIPSSNFDKGLEATVAFFKSQL